jgi:exodeoxyribonuclease V alpha subunit
MTSRESSRLWPIHDRLALLSAAGVISALDLHFASGLAQIGGEADADVLVTVALASRAVTRGHVCLELHKLSATLASEIGQAVDLNLPSPADLLIKLRRSPLVAELTHPLETPTQSVPLLLDAEGRLYLHRHAAFQARLAKALLARSSENFSIDEPRLRADLARFFPSSRDDALARLAALIVVRSKLAVISGGPGTGKTTIVAKLLALLQLQTPDLPLRVLLLAPTGKAAARLHEAIGSNLERLDLSLEATTALASKPSTIHRALGYRRITPNRFRHDAQNPLAADIVLVDEASMIDLTLMTKLVEAVRRDARLILLGDKDQLASVEAGAIFGDICQGARARAYSSDLVEIAGRIAEVELDRSVEAPGLQDCIVQLTKSYRYAPNSSIARLARAVTSGSSESVLELLKDRSAPDLSWFSPSSEGEDWRKLPQALHALVRDGLGRFFAAEAPADRLEALGEFRVLCAHRRGPGGVELINRLIERELLPRRSNDENYPGRPILITENDYQLELFNGDIGVLAEDPDGRLRAYFAVEGALKSFLPARLPAHETVFAMTVHTSQGSEFDRVAIVLPRETSAVVTRELLYTAITRAKKGVVLYGSGEVVTAGVTRRLDRASGLSDALRAR